MPELPGTTQLLLQATYRLNLTNWVEVERAKKIIKDAALGGLISSVTTAEDAIVFSGGITHDEFVGYGSLCIKFPSTHYPRRPS
jgi:hypothetical protein